MPHRYVCSVLEEMRTCLRLLKIDMLPGLVEEVQTLVNRMEAKLADYSEMGYNIKEARKLKKQVDKYREEIENLEDILDIDDDEEDDDDG
jgi:hypothetical protein